MNVSILQMASHVELFFDDSSSDDDDDFDFVTAMLVDIQRKRRKHGGFVMGRSVERSRPDILNL